VDRRQFLKAAVVTGSAATVAGCTHAQAARVPLLTGGLQASGWKAFEAGLDGDLVRPGEQGYHAAKLLYNPRFDALRPTAVVRAASTADVAETIRFAKRHGLEVRLRSGGHSYVGASTAAGAIQLDLRALERVSYDAATTSVTIGPGARLFDVHTKLDPLGRTVPTGTCPTVAAAGLTLGGGVGVESRTFGLSCDSVEELTVVTADAVTRKVDKNHHADLFWACRGGGGGSFGVVTAMRMSTHRAHPMDFFFLRFAGADAAAVLRGWQRRAPVMPRSAWANVHVDVSTSGLDVRVGGLSLAGGGSQEAQAMQDAIGRTPTGVTTFTRSHHDGVRLFAGCSTLSDAECHLRPQGSLSRESFVAGSDIVGRAMRRGEVADLVSYLRARASSGSPGTLIIDPLGGRLADISPTDTAVPWRHALGIAQWYVATPANASSALVRSTYRWIRGGHQMFGGATSGGYVNYVEPGRPLRDYYGANYPRLRQVKAAYDPGDFFHSGYSVRLP
jgi:hypothetical protein